MKLREKYVNGVIYNFTYSKASKILESSQGTAHKHVTRMIDLGLAELQPGGNLKLTGVNALKSKETELSIPVPVETNKKRQIAQLRYVLIHRNLNRQDFISNKKSKIVKKAKSAFIPLCKAENKFIMKNGGLNNLESSLQERITLSNRRIGKILKRSTYSGKNYQKQLNEMGLIYSEPFFKVMLTSQRLSNLNEAMEHFECYYLKYINKSMVKQGSNTILRSAFRSNPIEREQGRQ